MTFPLPQSCSIIGLIAMRSMYVQSNYTNYAPISISNTVRAVIIYQADTVNSRFLMSLLEAFWRCTRRGSQVPLKRLGRQILFLWRNLQKLADAFGVWRCPLWKFALCLCVNVSMCIWCCNPKQRNFKEQEGLFYLIPLIANVSEL